MQITHYLTLPGNFDTRNCVREDNNELYIVGDGLNHEVKLIAHEAGPYVVRCRIVPMNTTIVPLGFNMIYYDPDKITRPRATAGVGLVSFKTTEDWCFLAFTEEPSTAALESYGLP